MVRFEQFELAPGCRLTGRIERGRTHVVVLPPELLQETQIAGYLSGAGGEGGGTLWLEELKDGTGAAVALRQIPAAQRLKFFAQFVGLVLRDGGLIETLSIRENLTLPHRYRQIWPQRSEVTTAELTARLAMLVGDPAPAVADAALLTCRPAEVTAFARRYWGVLQTLLQRPQLLIVFAPFAELSPEDRQVMAALLARYEGLEPESARLYVMTGDHEKAALAGRSAHELFLTLNPTQPKEDR